MCVHAQSLGGRRSPFSWHCGSCAAGGQRSLSPLSGRERDVFLQNSSSLMLACLVPGERRVAGESISQGRTGTASPLFSGFKFSTFWHCYMKNMGLMGEA